MFWNKTLAIAVGKRPSPSAAPLEDWPCGVIGSGFTTQRRLRSPTAGVVSSRPLLPVMAEETPSPRHLSRKANLCRGPTLPARVWSGPSADKSADVLFTIVDGKHYQTPVCEGPPPLRTPRCLLACRSTQVMTASTRQRPRVAA